MRVFIIGASGLVGGNCMHCMREDPGMDVIGTHYSFATLDTEYFNVFDPSASTFDISAFHPNVILHTGALTHVDYCEDHPDESYRHTVESTEAAIKLAERFNAKLIYISSDYVFDGKNGPYSETARPNPLSVYGKHKLQAEQLILQEIENHLILRVTNVYGSEIRGKNFISFLIRSIQSKKNMTIKLPLDQFATPINARDIGICVCRLIKDNKRGLYHLASDEYLSRAELAFKVLSFYPGSQVKIEEVATRELGQSAPRPLKGGLMNEKIKREYPDLVFSTVDDYMKENYGI